MCKTKMAVEALPPTSPSQPPPSSSSRHRRKPTDHHHQPPSCSSSSSSLYPSTTASSSSTTPKPNANAAAFTASSSTTTTSSLSSRTSLSSLRSSLPNNPHLYDISEIRFATNNFLSKTSSSSSSSSRSWRCKLRGKDVIIFQRKSHHRHLRPQTVKQKLSSISKSHHVAVVNLLGASISGEYLYLVYDYIHGASLADLLHNSNNPDFTVLNTWMSRMQVATDLANGLDYMHNNTGLDVKLVHNHIKSSSVIVTEPSLNAKICHFGTAVLCGEPIEEEEEEREKSKSISFRVGEIEEIGDDDGKKGDSPKLVLTRSNSIKFNGTRGYMSPEFQTTGIGTRKSDVYAFGIVLLELLSGEEPVKYKMDKATKEYRRISVVDAARRVVEDDGGGGGGEREGRLRKWVDSRLRDSFPVEVADKMTRLAVDCVHVDPDKRPDMRRVAGKISKLYLESRVWCDRMSIPTEFTVSFAPR